MHDFFDGPAWLGMHGLGWLVWLVLLGALVWLLLNRSAGRAGPKHELHRETPHEILRRRLAGGEIPPAEYEERKALLDRDQPPRPDRAGRA
jgi:putative membrane protein